MSRPDRPTHITYPPEMLPRSEDDDAEVVVCCGGNKCRDGLSCEKQQVIRAAGQRARLLN